jgi:hypothetical protein
MAGSGKKKRRDRKSAMAKHREGVQALADMLVGAGFTLLEDDHRDGETLPPFAFMISERYRMADSKNGILRDIMLRTDGPVVDLKGYFYKEAASHTSILRVTTYIISYADRKPDGLYLSLITGVGNKLLADIMSAQMAPFDPMNPSGIRLLDQTIDHLRAYRLNRAGLKPITP